MSKRFFGCHVSSAGGFQNAITNGDTLGVNTIQLHPAPPQRWNRKPFPVGYEEKFLELKPTSSVEKVYFHAIYLINLANPDPEKRELSKLSLRHHLDLISRIKGDGVVVHVGSNKDNEIEQEGYRLVAESINELLQDLPQDAPLLLEVAAGSGKIIGAQMEQLAFIYDLISKKDQVGFCLDTQHMWASGYDWQNDLEQIIAQIKSIFGLENVKCIHLNDSKSKLESRVDRHENLGSGEIGLDAIKAVIHHPDLIDIPFVLETPNLKDMETAKVEVEKLRTIINNG